MERCVILSASPEYNIDEIKTHLRPDDVFVVADGGWHFVTALGVTPLAFIADFDSSREADFDHSVPLVRFSSIKDCTDTEAAVNYAWEKGYRDFLMVGCCGGRLDHTYANFMTMSQIVTKGGSVCSLGAHEKIIMLSPGVHHIPVERERHLSILPFGGPVSGITLKNTFYPLENAEMTMENPLGISNEFLMESEQSDTDYAIISFKSGLLLIFLSKD